MSTEEPGRESIGLEDFEVGEVLGQGGCATVSRAVHTTLGVPVALKVWHRAVADRQREKFLAECRLQWRLSDHPHIVRLHWVGASGQRPWIAMELYDGSLADLLVDGPVPLDTALVYADDLLAGLEALHHEGHLHRDVKPANVLVKDGRAALGDLGIVLATEETTADCAAGTLRYLAPELARGAQPSLRSDVYSAAMTISTLVGPDAPAWLDDVLTKATSYDPADRPADAAALRTALTEARPAEVLPPAAVHTGVPTETPSAARVPLTRRPRVLAAAVTAVLLGGIAASNAGDWIALEPLADRAAALDVPAVPPSALPSVLPAPSPSLSAPASGTPTPGAPAPTGSAAPTGPSVPVPPVPSGPPRSKEEEQAPAPKPPRPSPAPDPRPPAPEPSVRPIPVPPLPKRVEPVAVTTLRNVWAGRCMTVYGPFVEDGTGMQLWHCDKSIDEERWRLTSDGHVRGYVGKCLAAAGEHDGSRVELQTCADVPEQRWQMRGGELRVFGDKCLDPRGPSDAVGTPLQIFACDDLSWHQWRFTPA